MAGQHQYYYNVDSLLLQDGTITTDSVQIHNKLTEVLAEHFVCPQHHIHSPFQADDVIEHEGFLTHKDYFEITVAQFTKQIPEEALDSIQYGISDVPQRPQLCKDMDAIFDKEIA